MDFELPDDDRYDVILLGTGVVQSVLCGALARVGRRVLHLDQNEYYGGDFATFTLQQFVDWGHKHGIPGAGSADTDSSPSVDADTKVAVSVAEVDSKLAALDEKLRNQMEVNHPACQGYRMYKCHGSEDEAFDAAYDSPVFWGYAEQRVAGPGGVVDSPNVAIEQSSNSDDNKYFRAHSMYTVEADRALNPAPAPPPPPYYSPLPNSQAIQAAARPKLRWQLNDEARAKKRLNMSPLELLLDRSSRDFCIDLSPRLVLCSGSLVEMLIQSGVGRYMEFKALEDVFVFVEKKGGARAAASAGEEPTAPGEVARVPCKKGEIFSNRSLGMLEKRVLMKFLQVRAGLRAGRRRGGGEEGGAIGGGNRGGEKEEGGVRFSCDLASHIVLMSP
jgi:hypothetical protein